MRRRLLGPPPGTKSRSTLLRITREMRTAGPTDPRNFSARHRFFGRNALADQALVSLEFVKRAFFLIN